MNGSRRIRLLISLAALALFTAPAYADTIVFDLNNFNRTGFTAPYVQVTVNRTSSTTAMVTFNTIFAGVGDSYVIGDHEAGDLNVSGSFSATCGMGCVSIDAANNVNGFGTFNLTADDGNGFSSPVNTFVINLTLTSGTWSSASDVLIANGSGGTAAAHIAPTSNTACTGYVSDATEAPGGSTGCSVPEPSTLMQAGTGLSGVALLALFGSGMPALRRRFGVHEYPLSTSSSVRLVSTALRNVRRVGRVSVCS